MTFPNNSAINELESGHTLSGTSSEPIQTHISAVSWGAIVAGAAAIAALSLILLMLGTGLELSSVSPWAYNGVSATTFGVSTILWLTFTQLFASGMGGYITGRLRTKWFPAHSDEAHFRDTAHGFLAWAVATLVTAALLTSVVGSIVKGGIEAGAVAATTVGSGMVKSDSNSGPMGYYVDSLFRKDYNKAVDSSILTEGSDRPINTSEPSRAESMAEVTRIFMNFIRNEPLPAEDIHYVSQVVAFRTGLTQQDAEKRVTDTYAQLQAKVRDAEAAVKEAADKGRKASAYAALWLFISLLIGAYIASLAATIGGRQRDL